MDKELPVIDWGQHAQPGNAPDEMSRELLALFIQQLPELQERFQQAYASQHKEELQAVLHRLQGACAYCGLPRLRNVIADVSHALKQTGVVSSQQYEQIEQEIAVIEAELKKHSIA